MKTKSCSHGRSVEGFLAQHGTDITGLVAGYDRIRLCGSLRYLYQPSFMIRYLCEAGVKLKDFAAFVSSVTNRVCAATAAFAAKQGWAGAAQDMTSFHFSCGSDSVSGVHTLSRKPARAIHPVACTITSAITSEPIPATKAGNSGDL